MTLPRSESDDHLQAAWLHHVGRMSQQQVCRHLGLSRYKVLPLLDGALGGPQGAWSG